MTQLKAIIFDVDGTLANTEEAHRQAFNFAFKQHGLEWDWSVELYTKLLKVTGGKERIRHYVHDYLHDEIDQDSVVKLHECKNERYQTMVKQKLIPLRAGISRIIDEAKKEQVRIAIATTTSPGNVTNLVTSTMGDDALDWFEVIAAADVVPIKKPKPDVYEYVLDKMNLQPQECIALEDSYNGVVAATCINIPTVITVNNYTENDEFDGAMLVVDQLGDPENPCSVIDGNSADIPEYIDIKTLKKLHKDFITK